MKKILARMLMICLALALPGGALAQPLEQLIVDVVREEQSQAQTILIPNMNEIMGEQGLSQGVVDAGGILRGEAFLYEFESAQDRVRAAWRLDAALIRRGFEPGEFAFEGASYTLYSTSAGGILLMDGVTETTTVAVLAGDFRQEGETAAAQTRLTLAVDSGEAREYILTGQTLDGSGLTLAFGAAEPMGDGYDAVQVRFPWAGEAREIVFSAVYLP